MLSDLELVIELVYSKNGLEIKDLVEEQEGKDYKACNYKLNGKFVFSRTSKITPKKIGQFVTFWKRNIEGITEPYDSTNEVDYLVVLSKKDGNLGQFVFPKSVLINNKIITDGIIEGKRGFRVYPPWDKALNKTAIKTQDWQLKYFYLMEPKLNTDRALKLYSNSNIII